MQTRTWTRRRLKETEVGEKKLLFKVILTLTHAGVKPCVSWGNYSSIVVKIGLKR